MNESRDRTEVLKKTFAASSGGNPGKFVRTDSRLRLDGRGMPVLGMTLDAEPNQMNAVLQTLGTIVVLPYMLLATAFLIIRDVASTRGLFGLIDAVLNHSNWIFRWGIYGLFVFLVVLIVAGFLPSFQRISAVVLFLIALGSLSVICTLNSTRIGFGEVVFLVPCIAVMASSTWLFIRLGSRPTGLSKVALPSTL